MTAFSDYYQAFPDPVSLILKLKKMEYDVTNHLLDRQHIKFSPGNGVLAGSDSSEAITAQAVNLSNGAANAQLYLYESSLESLGLEEIINPTKLSDQQSLGLEEIINPTKLSDQQVAAAAFYGPSVGVDLGERLLYPGTKSTGREEIMGCNANHLLYNTPEDGSGIEVPLVKNNATCWKMKNRKADPYIISKSVFEENVPVPLKKSNRDRSKSWATSSASRVREEKSDPELDVIRREPPELQSNIVTKEQKAESRKGYIHVRARRGQATDNHSLAERVRRRKLNDRMNTLQSIVPGCSKISNKALMLEEIINYVQSLQNQVKNLSMKLATISPISTFHHEMTGQFSRDLLPRELRTDAMIAYGTNPYYVDHTPIVAEHPPEGTFV